MPSRPLTVTLNANHSRNFAVLVSFDDDETHMSIKDRILKDARNKFRMKALSTVFLKGGEELLEDQGLHPDIKQVWVGKGEPYSGPLRSPTPTNNAETRTTHIKSYVDTQAISQLRAVASLPGVVTAVGMPDLHPGNRFPVGCAIVSQGVYPALVGSDIGCGIALYRLLVSSSGNLPSPEKLASRLRGLDDPWEGDVRAWLNRYNITRESTFDKSSLGTVGAGNHFAEICSVQEVPDPGVVEHLDLPVDTICLLVHTGSRGIGAEILTRETENTANPYLPPDSLHLNEYIEEHDYAVSWAQANRDLVAHRIRQCLFGDEEGEGEVDLQKILEVTHNSVTKSISENGEHVWIHRKGAAPADKGIVPCAGSRGTLSWLVQPLGGGVLNAMSLPHGAGRRHPRAVLHTKHFNRTQKEALVTTKLGSHVICTDNDLLLEERPEAYKNIEDVISDIEESGIGRGVVSLRPIVTYKIREAGERRG